MKAKTLDKKFDDNKEDILNDLRVNVDFPIWMITSLDKEAKHLGVTRQSIIKVWLAERLENRF